MIGVKRRSIERHRPVGLIDRQPVRPPPVEHIRVERNVACAGGVEFAHCPQKSCRVHAGELGRQLLQRVCLRLGDAADAILAAQQRVRLGIKNLPGEHARQAHDPAAVFRIGVAVEIGALIDIALALGIDEDAEWIVVLLELVADGEVAIGRRVDVPGHRVASRPVAVRPRAGSERHVEARAHVETSAADFRELPARPEIAGAHLRIGFKAAAGKYYCAGVDRNAFAAMLGNHPGDAAALADQADRGRLVHDWDAAPLHIGVKRVEQLRAAAPDMQREPPPELELSVDLVSLTAEPWLQLHTLLRHPFGGGEAAAHQNFAQVRIGAIFGHLEHVVEELLLAVGPEIDVREVFIGKRRQDRGQILDAVIGETERAAGEMRVAAPLLQGSGFEDEHAGAVLMRRDRGAKRGVAGSHHEHVRPLAREIDRWHDFQPDLLNHA